MVTQYRIVGGNLVELLRAVNEALIEGWQPLGGPIAIMPSDGTDAIIMQAMIRTGPETK